LFEAMFTAGLPSVCSTLVVGWTKPIEQLLTTAGCCAPPAGGAAPTHTSGAASAPASVVAESKLYETSVTFTCACA